MKRTKLLAGTLTILAVAWLVTPIIHSVRRLCPVRPTGVTEAQATSQFSRRYNVDCRVCHAGFPRLTSFGEKFKMNGYQMPGGAGGDETATKVSDRLVVPKLGDVFGLRIALTPFAYAKSGLTKNGGKAASSSIGRGNWLQVFTAGPIYKNVSIFIETELQNDKLHNNWMYLGFHNLAGPEGYLNARVGNLPAMDWHTISGRLRANPPLKYSITSDFKSAAGATGNEDQLGIGSANAGVEVYGYAGPLVYSAVVQDGKQQTASGVDKNQDKNFAGTLGLRMPDGDLEGSQVSVFGLRAVDTKTTSTTQFRDTLKVVSPGLQVRYKDFDFQSAFLYAEDDNWDLTNKYLKVVTRGIAASAGRFLSDAWFAHLQWDWLESPDVGRLFDKGTTTTHVNKHFLSPSIWWFPRENLRWGLTVKYDMETTANTAKHGYKNHEVFSTIRAMF
ncbi:MAG: hypothetical protein HY549_12400 [Elusimicrobia bacterium]|nr:hypothetical protein [Elusimicrobiota bacterium]